MSAYGDIEHEALAAIIDDGAKETLEAALSAVLRDIRNAVAPEDLAPIEIVLVRAEAILNASRGRTYA